MLFDTITHVSGADHLYDIAGSTLSTPEDGDIILRFTAVRPFKLPGSFAGTKVSVGTNPSSTATLTVKKNGSGFTNSTITVNTSGVETLGAISATSFAADDVFEVELTTANGIDDLGITFKTLAV